MDESPETEAQRFERHTGVLAECGPGNRWDILIAETLGWTHRETALEPMYWVWSSPDSMFMCDQMDLPKWSTDPTLLIEMLSFIANRCTFKDCQHETPCTDEDHDDCDFLSLRYDPVEFWFFEARPEDIEGSDIGFYAKTPNEAVAHWLIFYGARRSGATTTPGVVG